jgi:large subunit ribosomal protein L46
MLSNTVSLCQWKCGKSLRLISHSNCFSADAYRSISTHTSPVSSSSLSQETIQPKKPPRTELRTAIVLSRTPILNRAPTSFERAYYAYQTGIARALHNPIPYDFYFKPGSPLEARFNVEERRREVKSFGQRFGEMSMGDLGAGVAPDQLGLQEGEGELIMPRVHEADRVLDFKSLNRRGQQNLYLLLNRKEGQTAVWRLPQGDVEQGEFLHQASPLLRAQWPYSFHLCN